MGRPFLCLQQCNPEEKLQSSQKDCLTSKIQVLRTDPWVKANQKIVMGKNLNSLMYHKLSNKN